MNPTLAIAEGFAQEQLAPNAAGWERRREYPDKTLRQAIALGLGALLVPADVGGAGLTLSEAVEVFAALAAADFAATFALVTHNNTVRSLAAAGKLLQSHLNGELICTFCLTEPGAGSDAAAISCQATQRDGSWVLEGEKAWITSGVAADVYTVYAQTDAAAGWRGIASFVVKADNAGLARTEPYQLLGGHSMGTAGITLHDCELDSEAILAPPGAGFKAAMAGINAARVDVAAMCCGMLRTSLRQAISYTKKRRAFGRAVAEFQGVQFQLADVATQLEAGWTLVRQAAAAVDLGRPEAAVQAAHAKKFATTAALPGIAACMQAMGAEGLKDEHVLGRHLAAAKIAQYLDGTTEIQNLVIGRGLGFTKA